MINERHKSLQINGRCRKDVFQEPKPFAAMVETGMDDPPFLFLNMYQPVSTGNNMNKAKTQVLPKVISLK